MSLIEWRFLPILVNWEPSPTDPACPSCNLPLWVQMRGRKLVTVPWGVPLVVMQDLPEITRDFDPPKWADCAGHGLLEAILNHCRGVRQMQFVFSSCLADVEKFKAYQALIKLGSVTTQGIVMQLTREATKQLGLRAAKSEKVDLSVPTEAKERIDYRYW